MHGQSIQTDYSSVLHTKPDAITEDDVNHWVIYLAAWLKDQRGDRSTAVLDLNREMLLRNALLIMAVMQPSWWDNQSEQATVWKGQGWEIPSTDDLRAGQITFRRLSGT
jgi:hypothetical protein